jgi:spore germination cell wall hydrolase CwlJ-like protein
MAQPTYCASEGEPIVRDNPHPNGDVGRPLGLRRSALALLSAAALSACAGPHGSGAPEHDYAGLRARASRIDPGAKAIVDRNLPGRREDLYDRTPGWESYDLSVLPSLGVGVLSDMDAQTINSLRRVTAPAEPVRPFFLKASASDRSQALKCLTQAVYYEAATEPLKGQQAVAQTVINRLRHPGYPKSICGVVFEGAMRSTGCQFSFTCDGSLARAPEPTLWKRAQGVAKAALNGFVAKDVGTATHYHADYVSPYWAPTLLKIAQVGAHIFYRWTGPEGEPGAFTARYQGGERNLTAAILQGIDERIQGRELTPTMTPRKITLALAGEEARTYTVAAPPKPGETPTAPAAGTLVASRRMPTKEEVAKINEKLNAIAPVPTPPSTPPPATAGGFTTDLPIGQPPKP